MAEITLSLPEFKKFAEAQKWTADYSQPRILFESADAVAMPFGMHLIRAAKRTPFRLFSYSVPMIGIGYSGIATWEMNPLQGSNGRKKRRVR